MKFKPNRHCTKMIWIMNHHYSSNFDIETWTTSLKQTFTRLEQWWCEECENSQSVHKVFMLN